MWHIIWWDKSDSTDSLEIATVTHHALHTMGQQQHYAIVTDPFGLARADELVYDALGCVVKIPKLSLPAHQCIWTGHSKSKFKAWHKEHKVQWDKVDLK